jgi:carbon-monoxide dehydrogenase medium subunit
MIPAPFSYLRPDSLEAALTALSDPEARPLAGGHSLLPLMKLRLARPGAVVDLAGSGLAGIRTEGEVVRIGAMTTYDAVLRSDAELPDALREAIAGVGDLQVRNAGTLGGSIAFADPASDVTAAGLALGARLSVRSLSGARELALNGFHVGPYTTSLDPQELIVEVIVPVRAAFAGSAYVSFEDRASGYALAGAAVAIGLDGTYTVGLVGAAAAPLSLPSAARALEAGREVGATVTELQIVREEEAGHRRALAALAIERAAVAARARAQEAS